MLTLIYRKTERVVMFEKNKIKDIDYLDYDEEALIKKYPLFKSRNTYLQNKYPKLNMSASELIDELDISNSEFYERKKKGVKLPDYLQENEKGRIDFPVICVAIFMSKNLIKVYS